MKLDVVTINESMVETMAELDQKLFGPHVSLTDEDLLHIHHNGLLMAVFDDLGNMVGESQTITMTFPEAEEPLVQVLPANAGYLEGYAVDSTHQGQGLGKLLLQAAHAELVVQGKAEVWATVRAENAPSVSNLLSSGYQIIGYSPEYYPGSPRLVVWKDLIASYACNPPMELVEVVEITPGDELDTPANKKIQHLLGEGFVGLTCLPGKAVANMGFVLLSSLTDSQALSIAKAQEFLAHSKIV